MSLLLSAQEEYQSSKMAFLNHKVSTARQRLKQEIDEKSVESDVEKATPASLWRRLWCESR